MTKSESGRKLPAKSKDRIIEINFREVVTGFVVICGAVFVLGSGLILVRDHVKYRRQKSLIDGVREIISGLRQGGVKIEEN